MITSFPGADDVYAWLWQGTAPSSGQRWLALFEGDDFGTDEVAGGSYARQRIDTDMDTPADGDGVSTSDVTFSALPAVTVTHWAVYDAVTAGTLLIGGDLADVITVDLGADVTVATGDLAGSVDGADA